MGEVWMKAIDNGRLKFDDKPKAQIKIDADLLEVLGKDSPKVQLTRHYVLSSTLKEAKYDDSDKLFDYKLEEDNFQAKECVIFNRVMSNEHIKPLFIKATVKGRSVESPRLREGLHMPEITDDEFDFHLAWRLPE
ncbi:hypothetical protein VNO77_18747 [Canavalia gladiata]|uniref:Uncharacterized protein n=1 Tax=Canavalia gladiata TaxID=3824 RepID=A0AAN9QJX4_CANGL